jgi:NAD(P)-dependent dehydrogenase (short-subunit alcohol dehydrogenase family)
MVEGSSGTNSSRGVLAGQVAVVTGGGKGIGLGCARVMGRAGASIAVVDLDDQACGESVRELGQLGITAEPYRCDVGKTEDVNRMIEGVVTCFGRIDVVVNNAGIHDSKSLEDASEADWDRIITNNLKSMYLVVKAALPYLKASKGRIVNMSSMAGVVGQGHAAAYASTKGAIITLSKNLALDLAPYGIRVNAICPGWVETPLVNLWFALQPDEVAARKYIYSVHPLGRIATSDEVGEAALFLASDASSFITGVALPVDGGVTLGY